MDWSRAHRLRNVQNKMPMQPMSVKPSSAPHHSKQNENRDPANSETGKKAPVRPGLSRLPVPVKNLRLHTPSEFSQSHCEWEEKPLTVSNAFVSCFKKKYYCTDDSYVVVIFTYPYRGRRGQRSHAPGQYLSTCLSPRAQEWPLKMSNSWLFHNQGLPPALCTLLKIYAMTV